MALADAADAVLMGLIGGHFLHREQVGLVAELVGRRDHLREAARRVEHQFVRQQHRERLVADDVARAPDRVAEAERRLLAGEAHRAGFGLVARQNLLLGLLAARGQRGVELEHAVEMILDHALVAAGDEDEMLDAGFLAPRRPRTGSAACRRWSAFPSASPWWRAGRGCRGRRRERRLCGFSWGLVGIA